MDNSVSEILKRLREQLGMSQQDLAQRLGTTVGSVSRWERGIAEPSRLASRAIEQFAAEHDVVAA